MARLEPRLLSRPHEVHFAGFRSDTFRLQQAGWQLSVEQDILRRSIRLAMKFEPARLYMMSEANDFDFYGSVDRDGRGDPPLQFVVRHCSSNFTIQLMESQFDFRPIDATPQVTTVERRSIEDFNIFAPALARTEEIIVEPKDVQACLDLIRKLQAPELEAVRKRNQRREGSSAPMPQHTFHAQILSLAA